VPLPPTDIDAPYLCRPLRAVLLPENLAQEVRAVLTAGGVGLLPIEQSGARTHVVALAEDADLERAASVLRDYAGWPY
jgi:hypothetical protein